MVRLWPRKIFQFFVGGGGQGISFDTGADTQSITSLSMEQVRDTGTQTESLANEFNPTLAIGTETESMAFAEAVAAATYPQGTQAESLSAIALAQSMEAGVQTDAMSSMDLAQVRDTGTQAESMSSVDLAQARDTGTGTESMVFDLAHSEDTGADSQAMAFQTSEYVLPIGTQTESQVFQQSEMAIHSGTETESLAVDLQHLRDTGMDSVSMAVDAAADLSQYTTSGTAVTVDTPAWTSPTNAQGSIDGTEAAVASPGLADTGQNATLRCAGLVAPTTPTGFTKTAVKIRLVDRWDLTITGAVASVLDVTMEIVLRDSADVAISTLKSIQASSPGGTQATLLTEEFDISGLVSDAQLTAGVKVDFRVFTTGAFVSTVNGNYSWQVDACHLVISYSRTGIV